MADSVRASEYYISPAGDVRMDNLCKLLISYVNSYLIAITLLAVYGLRIVLELTNQGYLFFGTWNL